MWIDRWNTSASLSAEQRGQLTANLLSGVMASAIMPYALIARSLEKEVSFSLPYKAGTTEVKENWVTSCRKNKRIEPAAVLPDMKPDPLKICIQQDIGKNPKTRMMRMF